MDSKLFFGQKENKVQTENCELKIKLLEIENKLKTLDDTNRTLKNENEE